MSAISVLAIIVTLEKSSAYALQLPLKYAYTAGDGRYSNQDASYGSYQVGTITEHFVTALRRNTKHFHIVPSDKKSSETTQCAAAEELRSSCFVLNTHSST